MTFSTVPKNMDLSKIKPYSWDTYMNGTPYYVYKIEGCYHCIGGRYGNNDLWCAPRDQKPTHENLIGFNGLPVEWCIEAKEHNYYRSKYDCESMERNYIITITRNGKKFYSFVVNDMSYGIAKAQVLLAEIHEHPIMFDEIDYANKYIIGREILWKDEPAIITRYLDGDGSVIIQADIGADKLKFNNEDGIIKSDILLSTNINWYRD